MPILRIIAEDMESGERKLFFYNNITGKISEENNLEDVEVDIEDLGVTGSKDGPFNKIKIQLGMSCNYDCSYCSQRFVERPPETSKKDIDSFMEMLEGLPKVDEPRIEFWGGEPFVYWKTLKPLAERIRERYPKATFFTVTNGSLITKEIATWLNDHGFCVAISHDGPGQHVRGDDPLETNFDAIKYLIDLLLPSGRFSFNAVLNKQNSSRLKIIEFFENKFPDLFISHGEMDFIASYDEGGYAELDFSLEEHFAIRRDAYAELRLLPKVGSHCMSQVQRANMLPQINFGEERKKVRVTQKCGMDQPGQIAIDLKGNILTCQNVSAIETAPNGQSHKIGHVNDYAKATLKTSTHWSSRPHCKNCPVVLLCRGSCMFLEGDNWYASCDASFSNVIPMFAIGFEQVTGFAPVAFDEPHLPKHRQDIWGTLVDWSVEPDQRKRKVIPIVAKHDVA